MTRTAGKVILGGLEGKPTSQELTPGLAWISEMKRGPKSTRLEGGEKISTAAKLFVPEGDVYESQTLPPAQQGAKPGSSKSVVRSFIADTAAEAVAKIREEMGPDAVALHVRPVHASGLARIWSKPKIEVMAYVPEVPVIPEMEQLDTTPDANSIEVLRQELDAIKEKLTAPKPVVVAARARDLSKFKMRRGTPAPAKRAEEQKAKPERSPKPKEVEENAAGPLPPLLKEFEAGHPTLFQVVQEFKDVEGWHLSGMMKAIGLVPILAQRLKDEIVTARAGEAPSELKVELELLKKALERHWRPCSSAKPLKTQVFIGASGCGKSTLLCKLVARLILGSGGKAKVMQVDGRTANPNGLVNIYGEILGVPVERATWEGVVREAETTLFVDLPGVNWRDAGAVEELKEQLQKIEAPECHLVLNGAYDAETLLAQARAFSSLPVHDIAVTHLDEEKRWGKLWNLVLGTNYSMRWLSTGQNIPGDLLEVGARHLLKF